MMTDKPSHLLPKLRFPEFHNDGTWGSTMLGQVCRIATGKKDANEGCSEGPYPFFTCAENHIFSKSYSFDTEAILVAGNANVGLAKYYNGKFEAYQRTYVLTDFASIDVPYLFTVLSNSLRPALLAQVQTSAMSYIRLPMLQAYELTVPKSFTEQQKIADCLGSLDDLIAAEGRKLETLRQHKQGLMQQLFPLPGETVPRLRFPEFRDGPRWDLLTLSSASDVNPSNDGLPESFIYIDLESVKSSMLIERKQITRDAAPSRAQRLLSRKDIIYQTVRPYQRNNFFFDINDGYEYVASTGYAQLRAHECPEFLYQLLHTESFVNSVLARCTGSNYPAINPSVLASIHVAQPRKPEQQKIADCLGSLDDLIAAEGRKLETLQQHKQGLLQQLFPSLETE